MVNIVGLVTFFAIMQRYDVAHGFNDVFLGKRGMIVFRIEAKLLVDLVAADIGEVVALRVEEQALEQAARGIYGGRLARAQRR